MLVRGIGQLPGFLVQVRVGWDLSYFPAVEAKTPKSEYLLSFSGPMQQPLVQWLKEAFFSRVACDLGGLDWHLLHLVSRGYNTHHCRSIAFQFRENLWQLS